MSVLVVGSTALDSIQTPHGFRDRLLGGSASYAALAASFFAPVRLVGIVGTDFPRSYLTLLRRRGIDVTGMEQRDGPTFQWSGEYEPNMNRRRTLRTDLGVFAGFRPELPDGYRRTPWILLANISPELQLHVLQQVYRPRLVAADTMDLWLETARTELLQLLQQVDLFILNESEAAQLTGEASAVPALRRLHAFGPPYVIIKKGEHGAILSGPNGLFLAPAFPLARVVDPTGAGDSFAGALLGYLAAGRGFSERRLRRAMIYASAVASFCCEEFGVIRLAKLSRSAIEKRVLQLRRITRF
ncbi:MAG: PfkB family carbohydrate kinase [Verrucomicrobiota bacterium]|nr:PfkB family carbohydrate kinase [Limisphaera sp.]MDW8380762.1 PfkB family carbohydrate kinase [Verrucomicrobiota bacterium]